MTWGTIEKQQMPGTETIRRRPQEAAVKCWFTASGRAIPLSMKLQDQHGEIFSVDEIFVTSCEKKYYAGSVAWEYKCRIVFRNQQRLVTLLFQPETCRWKVLAG